MPLTMFDTVTLDAVLWTTLKGSVIAALAFAATLLLRRRPAAVRHAIWAVAVIAQMLLPFGGSLMPSRTLEVSVPLPIAAAAPAARVQPAPKPTPATVVPAPAPRTWRWPDLRVLLAIGSGLFLLRIAFGTLRVILIARGSERVVDGEWLSLVQHHCRTLGITRPVTLLRSENMQLPVTWGVIYPIVLLPAAARSWTPELRRHVLLHELAHVRRADALTQLAGQLALALFWFNPMVWLAVARMRSEAENACDDYVLRDGERPSVYAMSLVELVRAHTGPSVPAFATLGIGRRSELEDRVDAITHPARDASRRRALFGFAVIAAALLMLPLLAVQRAAASNDDEEPKRRSMVVANGKGRDGIDCKPVAVTHFPFHQTSGTMTNDGVTTHYFFLRPTADRCLEASISFDARFTEDDRDFVAEPGLDVLLQEKTGTTQRVARIRFANGVLQRTFRVDGRDAAWDASAERWYRGVLPDVIRRTSAGIGDRARRIVEREGVEGLYAELERIPTNTSVRRGYLEALLTLRGSAALPREQVIARAREALGGYEPELANFLATIATREASNSAVRAAVLEGARRLRSAADRATVVTALLGHRDRDVRVQGLEAIELLPGDVWRRTMLERVAAHFLISDARLVDAYFDAVDRIEHRVELRQMLSEILEHELSPQARIRIEQIAGRVRS